MAAYIDVVVNGQPLPPRVKTPSGYENNDKFLQEMRERYDAGVSYDTQNILAAQDDARFVYGQQWDPNVEQRRRDRHKPVLTFNRVLAFVQQLIGSRLANETEIKVYPDKGGTKEVASIYEGLIRSIFKNSLADFARDEAYKNQVIGGLGIYCLSVKYASDDVFEQKISIEPVRDPYSFVGDPLSFEPTGEDMEWAFLSEDIPTATFKKRWPKAAEVSWPTATNWNRNGYWLDLDTIRIVSYWRMVVDGTKMLALMQDGTIQDVTERDQFEYLPMVALHPQTGMPYVREVPNRFARMYVCSGEQILEGPYDYPLSSIPIYRVPGWEVNDGNRTYRWGLVRFQKDPQRLHNFWRSVLAEQLVSAPRNKVLTTKQAVQGYEKVWRDGPSSDDPFYYFNDDGFKPEFVPTPQVDQATMAAAAEAAQDMKDILNMHEASLGQQGNEVSGKAIQARQMVSDLGTFIYLDRLRKADERCAKNLIELIPYIYDTTRDIAIIGQDEKQEVVTINQPGTMTDVGVGKYGVTVSTGPATATKRQAALEAMMAFVNAVPESAAMVMDLVAKYQDWPGSGEFERRFKAALPPGVIPQEDLTPEQQQAQAQQSQLAQQQAEIAQQTQVAQLQNEVANAKLSEARAILALAQAQKAEADANARTADVQSKAVEREVKMTLGVIDQHNSLEAEDRDFAAGREDAARKSTENKNGD